MAGKIQFKHASTAAFEGYAGTSDSGFPQEVERERALGQMDDVLEYYDQVEAGGELRGGAAPRITKLFRGLDQPAAPPTGVVADRARLRTMLQSTARTLHVGLYADCFFEPASAECLRDEPLEQRQAPAIALCKPNVCANACIGSRHTNVWRQAHSHAKRLLETKGLSRLQRASLKADLARIEEVCKPG
ncbi:hypothetical protein ASD47_16125 [Caulobacter sp. Root1472]|nr:hypothetical protein ASD47_16125 [Caulobacter sp. Root1472]